MWTVEALKEAHQVSIVTAGGADLPALNAKYGTAVDASEVEIIETGYPLWLAAVPVGDALKGAWFQRRLRSIAQRFDLVLSTYNLLDVPAPAIQFIADFSWDDELRRKLHPEKGLRGIAHGDSLFRRSYLKTARLIGGGYPEKVLKSNWSLVVANSNWTARILRERYGVVSRVVYPPVVDDFSAIPAAQKRFRFVCIGRISPEKELAKVIAIVKAVRDRGFELDLHIIGDWKSSAYGRQLREHAAQQGAWIHFEGDCRGETKSRLLLESRFGIHGCTGEAFGIGVADMVKAGCITFVPAEGGAAEIVDRPELVYRTIDDAMDKIEAVLKHDKLQKDLTTHLAERAERFSEERFMRNIVDLVSEFDNGR